MLFVEDDEDDELDSDEDNELASEKSVYELIFGCGKVEVAFIVVQATPFSTGDKWLVNGC